MNSKSLTEQNWHLLKKKAEHTEQQKAYRAKLECPHKKAERNEQQKAYRAKVASPEKKTKLNECRKVYRAEIKNRNKSGHYVCYL